jgi:hypothetical protein
MQPSIETIHLSVLRAFCEQFRIATVSMSVVMTEIGPSLTRRTFPIAMLSLGAAAFPISAGGQDGEIVTIRMRVDDSVRGVIPPIILSNLTVEPDQSEDANELIRRSPPARAVPVMLIIFGAMAVPMVLQMIKELLRQTYYGGVIIDTRTKPPSVTSDPKIPANMVFVINNDGKTSQFASDQLSPEMLSPLLKVK